MNEHNISNQLKDIKPLLEIPDNSYYIYWSLIGFSILISIIIVFLIIKKLLSLRTTNQNKNYLLNLIELEQTDSKKFAYNATHYARLLSDIDEELRDIFIKLEEDLIKYKYKKVVDNIDEDSLKIFNHFVEVANGKI